MESARLPTARTIVNKAATVASRVAAPRVGLAFALGSAAEVDAASAWLDSNGVRRKPVSDGFTPGSRYVTFYDPDGIPLEFYYMDAVYADLYGVDVEPQ